MRIIDIARRMIELSGHTVMENGGGDIEISIIGLRPGEKLYEELLIDDDSLRATPHGKILCAEEALLSQAEVMSIIKAIKNALKQSDSAALRAVIKNNVDGYHRPLQD